MPTTYREKISIELDMIPEAMLPKFYRVFHTMIKEMVPQNTEKGKNLTKRKSLHGIWSKSTIDESLFVEAKHSLFSYENNEKSS